MLFSVFLPIRLELNGIPRSGFYPETDTHRFIRCVFDLPACFLYAGNLSLVSELAEADTADSVLTKVAVRASANLAAVVFSGGELLLCLLLKNHCFLCHLCCPPYLANGAPIKVRSSFASSSVVAVVTNAISIPRILSTLSYSISGKISCSRRPRE